MVRERKKLKLKFLLAALALLYLPAESFGQLLYKPEMEIENYARTGYNLYGRTQIARSSNPRYDSFGNYIMNGVQIFRWDEQKYNSRHTSSTEPNHDLSYINKVNPVDENEFFHFYLDDLVVLSENNKAFSSRFIAGNQIGVVFSPITLNMAALNGIRWDFDVKQNYLTLVSSRADNPLWFSEDYLETRSQKRTLPVYLTGGHYERKFGLFNVAANYVNTYRTDSTQSRAKNSITGTIPNSDHYLAKPLQLVVKYEDQSRYDGGGPRIYDIYPIVNGKERRELLVGVSKGSWKDDLLNVRRAVSNDDPNANLYQQRYFLDPLRVPNYPVFNDINQADGIAKFPNILAKRYKTDDPDLITIKELSPTGKDYIEANGENYLLFWFDLPKTEDISEVTFKTLVGNNYKISVSEVYKDDTSLYTTAQLSKVGATYFDVVKYSKGDVKDLSNLSWVTFEHGNATANMLMSLKIDSHFKGFDFSSEYSHNMQFKQYSSLKSKKFRDDAEAYYINLQKDFGDFKLGGEYFKMDPDYATSFRNSDRSYQELESVWASQWTSDATIKGNTRLSSKPQYYMNNTMIVDSVDDNDDKDRYPDWHIFPEVRDTNGVYPGLDENGNNRPDTNENDNLMPDHSEPFFLYNSDPDEYDYGQDLNNNGTLDVRENDDKPDYPYDLNTKGFHLFGSYGKDAGWKYTVGYVNYERLAGGGLTDVKYGVAEYNKFIPFFADIRFSNTFKKVKDSIQDNIFRNATKLTTTLVDSTTYAYNVYNEDSTEPITVDITSEKFYDPLRYRDSYVNSSYLETNLFRVPNLTIGMKLKYDINHQNGTGFQSKNDIIDRTQIFKAEYKYYLGDLLVNPQVKFMTRKFTNSDGYERTLHEQYFYPIIKVDYPLTVNTFFRAGAQGFPGLNSTVRNLMNDQLDYDTRHYVIMLSNKSFYSGYDFCLNFGMQTTWQHFNGYARQAYNRTDKVYFVRMVVGLEPIS